MILLTRKIIVFIDKIIYMENAKNSPFKFCSLFNVFRGFSVVLTRSVFPVIYQISCQHLELPLITCICVHVLFDLLCEEQCTRLFLSVDRAKGADLQLTSWTEKKKSHKQFMFANNFKVQTHSKIM